MYEINKSYDVSQNILLSAKLQIIFTHLRDIDFNFVITHQKDHRNSDLYFFWYIPFSRRDNCSISRDSTKSHIKKLRTYLMTTAINLFNNTQILHHISQ